MTTIVVAGGRRTPLIFVLIFLSLLSTMVKSKLKLNIQFTKPIQNESLNFRETTKTNTKQKFLAFYG